MEVMESGEKGSVGCLGSACRGTGCESQRGYAGASMTVHRERAGCNVGRSLGLISFAPRNKKCRFHTMSLGPQCLRLKLVWSYRRADETHKNRTAPTSTFEGALSFTPTSQCPAPTRYPRSPGWDQEVAWTSTSVQVGAQVPRWVSGVNQSLRRSSRSRSSHVLVSSLTETTMSPPLPPELLDHIINYLHDEPNALKACCLASKSWIQRTQQHLFSGVKFHGSDSCVKKWKEAFPDPTNSPAYHTRALFILGTDLIKAALADTMSAFRGVVCLNIVTTRCISLALLRGFSPSLKSLHLTFHDLPDSEIFGLVCSFPCLEDLALDSSGRVDRDEGWSAPPTSPGLTGSLRLSVMMERIQFVTHRLSELPNGLHSKKIAVTWLFEQDVRSTMDLISRCSDTLQSLDITNCSSGVFPSVSVPD